MNAEIRIPNLAPLWRRQPAEPRAGSTGPSRSALLPALLGFALCASSGCGEADAPAPAEPRSVRHVVIGELEAVRSRTFSGASRASQQSRLSFKVSGTLIDLPVAAGDRLQAGQLVARLDPFQYELEVERAEAELLRARAAERNATAVYERTRELYADSNASRGDLDAARANAESSTAQTRSAEKALQLARLQVSYTELRAATDCSVAAMGAEVNENVGPGNTIATVTCGGSYEVQVPIPEGFIGELREGMGATVTFDALAGQSFAGTLTEMGVPTQGGATFPVSVVIEGSDPGLRSGLAAEVRFDLAVPEEAQMVLVPPSAVVREPGKGTFVFLAQPKGGGSVETPLGTLATVVRRTVELGELTAYGLEVESGLEVGDRVITAGTSMIYEGLEVRLGTEGI
ncbi:MAG: efflux RND transporter periplasmic adaptor subunit [Holophagales bacterium]|nr:efflux RND transporter periplasmic adaptor subunit [Holophagales bacterium]